MLDLNIYKKNILSASEFYSPISSGGDKIPMRQNNPLMGYFMTTILNY